MERSKIERERDRGVMGKREKKRKEREVCCRIDIEIFCYNTRN